MFAMPHAPNIDTVPARQKVAVVQTVWEQTA